MIFSILPIFPVLSPLLFSLFFFFILTHTALLLTYIRLLMRSMLTHSCAARLLIYAQHAYSCTARLLIHAQHAYSCAALLYSI